MDLFNQHKNDSTSNIVGLKYLRSFITLEEQRNMINQIDNQPWLSDLKRRVQHYGYKYDYKRRSIDNSMKLGEVPGWCNKTIKKMLDNNIISFVPDQIIVNEYLPGQGISNHIDCQPCFGDTVISLSLCSSCVMQFTNKENPSIIVPVLLEPCSLIVLKEDARYNWMHGIKAVKTDKYNSAKVIRRRRVSLTFRKVIVN